MANYPYKIQLPPLNVQDIPNDGVAGEFLGINGSGQLDWLTAGGGGSGDMLAANNLSELTNFATARTNIGLGTASTPTFGNLTLTSPSLASSTPVTFNQTWSTTGTYTAFKVNVTDSGPAAAASNLLDLQVGGVGRFSVRKDGAILGSAGVFGVFGGGTGNFFNGRIHVGDYNFSVGSNSLVKIAIEVDGAGAENAVILNKDAGIYWSTLASANNIITLRNSVDLALLRDSASGNTLGLRNGTNAQTFNVYGSYSGGGLNYARLALTCASDGNATISTQGLGSLSAASLIFSPNSVERMRITTAGNVGIGTTSPSTTLDVTGSFKVNGLVQIGPMETRGLSFFQVGTSTYMGQIYGATDGLQFTTNGGQNTIKILNANGNLGIGTTSPTSKLHVAETWNNAGTTFTAMKVDVTDTASNAASNLLDLQVGGVSKFSVSKTGAVVSAFSISTSYLQSNANIVLTTDAGALVFGAGNDLWLRRDEAYHLALRNGINGQKFSIYGTYPGAAWERFTITAPTSGNVLLGTYKGTGGIARGLELQTDGVTRMTINSAGTLISTPSNFNANNFAVTGSNITVLGHNGSAVSLGNGSWATQHIGSIFTFSGGSNLFPALKRSTTTLQVRLADDSAFTNIQGKLTTETAYTATTVTPTGFITLYDSTGTAYKVPCVPA